MEHFYLTQSTADKLDTVMRSHKAIKRLFIVFMKQRSNWAVTLISLHQLETKPLPQTFFEEYHNLIDNATLIKQSRKLKRGIFIKK